jgi:hypothetical protein
MLQKGEIVVPRPSTSASLSGRRQKTLNSLETSCDRVKGLIGGVSFSSLEMSVV